MQFHFHRAIPAVEIVTVMVRVHVHIIVLRIIIVEMNWFTIQKMVAWIAEGVMKKVTKYIILAVC